MKEIEVRKLEAKDAALLSKVAIKAYSDHYLHLWYDGGKWYINKCFTIEALTAELNDSNAAFYLALYDNAPVGFLKLNIDAALNGEDKNALELERIYLNKEATDKGIGSQLMRLTIKIAEENNKELVWLKAMDTNEASIAFYEKMGFTITGTCTLPHQLMKEELRGMVIMEKSL
jgi:ribosomal protein S18 acetylase RimI-like enzyme